MTSQDTASTEAPPQTRLQRLQEWVRNHDDSWLFFVPYILLAVILSAVISLFWLVVVVGVHFALEVVRQHMVKPGIWDVLSRSLWELKLDIGLILFALALGLYLEIAFGLVGLGSVARTGAMAGSRFVVLQRVIRGILLSLDDLAQVARVALRRKAKPDNTDPKPQAEVESTEQPESSWSGNWTLADRIIVGFSGICLLLIVLAPLITHHTLDTLVLALLEELQPFP